MEFFSRWGRGGGANEIRPGSQFCRRRRDNVTETATVVGLRPDPFGIPHVHFTVVFDQPSLGRVDEGSRVLALRSFVDAYRERIA